MSEAPRIIKLAGRAAGPASDYVPQHPVCGRCGVRPVGKWSVRMDDGTFSCQDCLTPHQRAVWLKDFEKKPGKADTPTS